ncbi:LysR family transcriptional regulator, partial [Oxalobacteraceae bacterium OM1]
AIRGRLDHWFEANEVRPDVVGEFEDNALLNTFGRNGIGLFPASAAMEKDVREQFGAVPVGALGGVREQFYAISNERKIKHPAVDAILSAIHGKVFGEEAA